KNDFSQFAPMIYFPKKYFSFICFKLNHMKKAIGMFALIFVVSVCVAQNPVNWTTDQLMEPSDLAKLIKEKKDVPVLFSVGPAATVADSKSMGMVREEGNLAKFKEELNKLPKK